MADNNNLPKWATPSRQTHLVNLFKRCGGFCVFGHKNCLIPEHHYELFSEDLISDWIEEDREQNRAELIVEQRAMHSLAERREPLKGRFSAISAKIYAENQPLYFNDGLGISGITLKPFAKIRIASSYFTLYIDLGDTLRRVSKNKRRKALRYGNPLPSHIERNVDDIVKSAVRDYLD